MSNHESPGGFNLQSGKTFYRQTSKPRDMGLEWSSLKFDRCLGGSCDEAPVKYQRDFKVPQITKVPSNVQNAAGYGNFNDPSSLQGPLLLTWFNFNSSMDK